MSQKSSHQVTLAAARGRTFNKKTIVFSCSLFPIRGICFPTDPSYLLHVILKYWNKFNLSRVSGCVCGCVSTTQSAWWWMHFGRLFIALNSPMGETGPKWMRDGCTESVNSAVANCFICQLGEFKTFCLL